jgi:hypothetical protein
VDRQPDCKAYQLRRVSADQRANWSRQVSPWAADDQANAATTRWALYAPQQTLFIIDPKADVESASTSRS